MGKVKKRRRHLRNRGYTRKCRSKKKEKINLLIDQVEKYKKAIEEQDRVNKIQRNNITKISNMVNHIMTHNI